MDSASACALNELETIVASLESIGCAQGVRIDFSVVNDMNYYSGVVFRGFVDGIPEGILSGGRYDKLMRKMGRKSGAIGFAVYLDMLERLDRRIDEFDVDTVLLYDENTDVGELMKAVTRLTEDGKSVLAEKTMPEHIRAGQIVRLEMKGGGSVEQHD